MLSIHLMTHIQLDFLWLIRNLFSSRGVKCPSECTRKVNQEWENQPCLFISCHFLSETVSLCQISESNMKITFLYAIRMMRSLLLRLLLEVFSIDHMDQKLKIYYNNAIETCILGLCHKKPNFYRTSSCHRGYILLTVWQQFIFCGLKSEIDLLKPTYLIGDG